MDTDYCWWEVWDNKGLGFLIVPPSDRPLHVSAVTVVCAVSEDCVLPCSFHPGSNETIQWFRQGLGVYTFKRGDGSEDGRNKGHEQLAGRTSLFQDQISRGNASLLLMWVKVEDQGRYMCYTSTDIDNSENFIELKVEGHISEEYVIMFFWTNSHRRCSFFFVNDTIICSSERIYPEPELSWSTNPPSPMRDPPKPEVQLMEDGLYNISSTIVKNSTALSSSCTVSAGRNKRKTTLFKARRCFCCLLKDPS
uniref:Ig-like domain-containing protein n=1 Tax=Takifugu rubripes TaxID=31033 RepID=A0A674P7M7_TAKRU